MCVAGNHDVALIPTSTSNVLALLPWRRTTIMGASIQLQRDRVRPYKQRHCMLPCWGNANLQALPSGASQSPKHEATRKLSLFTLGAPQRTGSPLETFCVSSEKRANTERLDALILEPLHLFRPMPRDKVSWTGKWRAIAPLVPWSSCCFVISRDRLVGLD
ncbi:hypothetical protein BJV77DRAFT_257879 [Russula vinacea]|nr:hypothetical protein BJV77DRAFT_257879 [Russula vinacea]